MFVVPMISIKSCILCFPCIPTIGNAITACTKRIVTFCRVTGTFRSWWSSNLISRWSSESVVEYVHNVNHFENLYSSILLRGNNREFRKYKIFGIVRYTYIIGVTEKKKETKFLYSIMLQVKIYSKNSLKHWTNINITFVNDKILHYDCARIIIP